MSMLQSFDLSPSAVLRDVLLIAAVIALAVIATIIFAGAGQPLSFDLTADPMGAYPW